MKIWMSKRSERTGKRTLVLDMTLQEEHDSFWVLREDVIGDTGRAPLRHRRRDGTVRYRFAASYLERLVLTFPFAEMSSGVHKRMQRTVEKRPDEPVPNIIIPEFGATLYDFQKIGVQRIIDHDRFILMDEMGLGKTVQALAAITAMAAIPTLVICPNSAKYVWERMINDLTPYEPNIVDGSAIERIEQIHRCLDGRADITIINIEALRLHPELAEFEFEYIITDEFHRFKSPTAQATEHWHAMQAKRWLIMSGTPILNRVEESWSGLHRLFPDRYPDYHSFERWVCRFAKHAKYKKVVGYRPGAMKKLRRHLHDPNVSIRRRKEEISDELPEVVYQQLFTELSAEQRRLYRRIVDDMELALANGEITTVRGILAVVTRCRQACFSPELYEGTPSSQKLTELKELVQQLVDNGEKAIIGAPWAKATRIMQRELAAYNPAYVDGSVKGRKRMAEVDRFNEDPDTHLYIGTIRANQEALTLDAATYVILPAKDWAPLVNDQFIGRSAAGGLRGVGRAGETVNVVEILARDTIDERIEGLLMAKRAMFDMLINNSGGAQRTAISVQEIRDLF